MVYLVSAAGAALVPDDAVAVFVDVDVDVEVDVLLQDLSSEPQPTSATVSATVMVAAVKCFFNPTPDYWGRYGRRPRRNDTSRNGRPRCLNLFANSGGFGVTRKLLSNSPGKQPSSHAPTVRDRYEVAQGADRARRGDGGGHGV